jgi:CspA family cold shock protein
MERGTVQWFSSGKGYGFIEPENGEEDVFAHHSEVPDEDLQEGDEVEFEVEETPKGLSAKNIRRVNENPW